MLTGSDLIAAARVYDGEPYSTRNPDRYEPDSGVKDCSGLWVCAHNDLGLEPPGFVSSSMAAACYAAGLECTIDEALGTVGGVLFMGADRGLSGIEQDGHVAVCLGNGVDMYEAPAWGIGRHGVGQDSAYFNNGQLRQWSGAARCFPAFAAGGTADKGGEEPEMDQEDKDRAKSIDDHLVQLINLMIVQFTDPEVGLVKTNVDTAITADKIRAWTQRIAKQLETKP